MPHSLRTLALALGFTTLGATFGLAAGALAGPSSRRGAHGPLKFAMAMASLDLTAEQQQMLTDLREEVQAATKATEQDQGDGIQLFTRAVVSGGAIDRAAIHTGIDKAAAAKAALAHKAIDGLVDVYDTLSDQQKADLVAMIKARNEQRARRQENLGTAPAPNANP